MGQEQQQDEDRMSGGLEDFLAQAIADGDDEGTGQEAMAGDRQEDPIDDGGDQEGADEGGADDTRQPVDSRSRLVQNLAKQEKALTGARSRIKELEQENERLRRDSTDPDDPIEMLRGRVARRMKLDPNDPAVDERLFEISQDITVARLGEAVDQDPELKKRRERLMEERRIRDERMDLERKKADLDRAQKDREAADQRRAAIDATRSMLNASPHPFLDAAEEDAAQVVVDLALRALDEGQVRVTTHEEGAKLLQTIAANLEAHHKQKALKLARLLDEKDGSALRNGMETGVRDRAASRKQGGVTKRNAASSAMGGGGRGRPEGRTQDDEPEEPEALHEFVNRMAQRAQSNRRGVR